MGWLSVLLSGIAAFLLFKSGHMFLMTLAIIAAIGCFWSWGVMHNFATEAARRRQNYTGGFYDMTSSEAEAAPDWVTWINMALSLLGLVMFIGGIVAVAR